MGKANQWRPGARTLSRRRSRDRAELSLGRAPRRGRRGHRAAARHVRCRSSPNPPVTHLSFRSAKDYESTRLSAPLVLVRRAVHVAARLGGALAADRRSALHANSRWRNSGRRRISSTTRVEKLYFRDSRFFERRDDTGPQAVLEPRQRLGVRRHRQHARRAAEGQPASPAPRDSCSARWPASSRPLQKPDGYWPPSLLAPENSPAETSGTGFYVYGLAWGVNRGLLDAAGISARHRPRLGGADARGGEGRPARLGAAGQ